MESSFQPPVRKSLSDEELAARVNLATSSHSGIEAVMVLLVAQEALRAQEDAEIAAWVSEMEENGSPEAVRALAAFRSNTQGTIPSEEAYVEPVTDHFPVQEQPVEEQIQEPIEEVAEPEKTQNPFSWFTRTQETPIVQEPVVEEIDEPIVEQVVVEEVTVDEPVLVEVVSEEPVLVDVVSVDLHPEGSETADAFEQLLAAASAEEEITALEDAKVVRNVAEDSVSNVAIPSDEHRDRKPLSQLLVWLGVSATLVPILLAVALIGFGLDATAVTIDLVVGYLVSGTLISVGALAGKRSGLSTAIVSRAVFGVWGNSLPLSILFVVRAVLTAIILSVFTYLLDGVEIRLPAFDSVLANLGGVKFTAGLAVELLVLTVVGLLTLAKGAASRTIQVTMSLLSIALVVESFIGLPFAQLSFATPGQLGFMSKESFAGIALVVMVTLTLWFAVAPNLAKSIPMKPRGARVFTAVAIANFVVPALVGVVALSWLGSSSGLVESVVALPKWSRGALVSGIAIALVYATLLSLKTAALDLVALVRIRSRVLATLISFVVVAGLLVLFASQPASQKIEYLVNVFTLSAALIAGWIGMFAADVSLRRIAYHELSLSRSYGFYKKFNILSVLLWVITLVAGIALIPTNLIGFSFFGFALPILGLEANLGSAALGFSLTVLLGIILTVAARIPQIRKQEREVLAVESRREQLNDIFVGQE